MAINFPASPTAGQKFMSGKTLYTFTNGAWRPTVGTALPRNYLVNPAMSVSQQIGTTATVTVNLAYGLDQWKLHGGGTVAPEFTFQQLALVTPLGSPYRLRATYSKLGTGTSATASIAQSMEGLRVADLAFGAANADQVVARFGFRSSLTGTYSFVLRNSVSGRAYGIIMPTITAGQVNTDLYFTFAIPGDTTGTWPKDQTLGMEFCVNVHTGAIALSAWSANAWMPTPNPGGPAQGTPTLSAVFDLFDCGLYADPNKTGRAPPWEHPSTRQATIDSQRYWNKFMVGRGISTSATTGNRIGGPMVATMRAVPALGLAGAPTLYDVSVNNALTALPATYLTTSTVEFDGTSSGMTAQRPLCMPNSTQANYIICNARL